MPSEAGNEEHVAWRVICLQNSLTPDLHRERERREGGREGEWRKGMMEGGREGGRGTYLVVLFVPGDRLRNLFLNGVKVRHLRVGQELLVYKLYRGREGGREGGRWGLSECTCGYSSDLQC